MHQTYEWRNKKGQRIFGQSWHATEPKALICHIHGQSDHSSRFAHVADYFNRKQISFFSADLVGHGKSEGVRGHVNHFHEYIETVDLLLTEAKKIFPGLPVFVYGHSMGGNICINHAFNTQEQIKGYIITSPWIRLAFEPPAWKIALGKTVKSIFPSLLQPTGLDPSLISHDKEVVQRYVDDKLVHGKISASAFFEILTNGKSILLNAGRLHYPILLMHGTGDALTDHKASREFAAMRPDLITYKEFEGLYHEMHNEPEQQQIFDTIYQWIIQKL